MSEKMQRRLARNEDVYREVNEGIVRGQWPGETDAPIGFRCECARLGCNMLVTLTLAEYQEIRDHPRRFVVLPGHQAPAVERVVTDHGAYVVVEKIGNAGDEAETRARRD
ncbi:MAG: hypothetical protein WAK93_03350 [Solirubrobacteraceae bacterium]